MTQYGILGLVVIGLVWFILFLFKREERRDKCNQDIIDAKECRDRDERAEFRELINVQFKRINDVTDETNRVIREHTNILATLKEYLDKLIK